MYRIFLFILFLFLGKNGFSQFASAGVEVNNVLYAGISNPLNAVAENTSCDDIIVKTTFGTISDDKNCQYTFKVNYDSITSIEKKSTRIEIYKKKGKKLKLLSSQYFKIEKLPDPVAHIIGSRDRVGKEYFQKPTFSNGHPRVPDIIADILFFGPSSQISCHFQVDSFRFSIFRKDSCIRSSVLNIGCFFSENTYDACKILEPNDKIVFDSIIAWGRDGSRRKLKSFAITVY